MTDDRVAGAVLAGLGSMSRRRLLDVCLHGSMSDAFDRLRSGRTPAGSMRMPTTLLQRLASQARAADPEATAHRLDHLGIGVVSAASHDYPTALGADPERPAVLFHLGSLGVLDAPRVGIVGTRNATAAGRATARELGEGLAAAGVCVVSGLALGVDAAAHQGALAVGADAARAVAVVGNGLDSCYPRHNLGLFDALRSEHLIISEWPPDTPPDAFRFPLRNRIIAALSEVLIVVESRERGGSLITARACLDRGVEVMVVPGSPRSRSSIGTNLLLRDGATPVTCVDDVLDALGSGVRHLSVAGAGGTTEGIRAEILGRVLEGPTTLDALVADCDLGIGEAVVAVGDLITSGHLTERDGWLEACRSRLVHPGRPR
ncbi:MAG: DNA-processing protein DprA [Ilumatobacteraceae bacterium]